MTGHGVLILVLVYLPPKKKLLRSDLEILIVLKDAVILFGDLNSKSTNWKCNYSNRNGRKMVGLAEDLYFNIVTPLTPIHYPNDVNRSPDILYIALAKGIPSDMILTDDIDNATGVLTNHIRTVVDDSSRVFLANSGCKELSRDVSELIRQKNFALRRARKYPTCENRSHARAYQCRVKARMPEVRNNK
ncbi:hypothetical protein EVAR_16975_1 [Eumeta japonica]|uniref:Endonuclease/exonuclease/phosphatase domain-containing protein n=1 Tax=Eumeta variegata TaxID=151549 RepID=A0A4C1TVI7_EUMVA|nr:hypothetical protein EVAR_16975_1 [Eumeta japonica]